LNSSAHYINEESIRVTRPLARYFESVKVACQSIFRAPVPEEAVARLVEAESHCTNDFARANYLEVQVRKAAIGKPASDAVSERVRHTGPGEAIGRAGQTSTKGVVCNARDLIVRAFRRAAGNQCHSHDAQASRPNELPNKEVCHTMCSAIGGPATVVGVLERGIHPRWQQNPSPKTSRETFWRAHEPPADPTSR